MRNGVFVEFEVVEAAANPFNLSFEKLPRQQRILYFGFNMKRNGNPQQNFYTPLAFQFPPPPHYPHHLMSDGFIVV